MFAFCTARENLPASLPAEIKQSSDAFCFIRWCYKKLLLEIIVDYIPQLYYFC